MLRPLLFSLVLAASARPASIREVQPHRTDVNHSSVGFSVPILGGISQVTGKFSRFKLDFDFDEEKPENSKVLDAKNVIVMKRSMGKGYAGIENSLFFHDKNRMLFGDAKDSLEKLIAEVKNL